MNRDEIYGKGRNLEGRAKQAGGALTGNRRLEDQGFAERVGGAIQDFFGRVRHAFGRDVEDTGRTIKR